MEDFKKYLQLGDGELEKILKDCGVSLKTFQESMDYLKRWFDQQPHFPHGYYDVEYTTKFLILNKFSLEKTKNKLENYYASRTLFPSLLCKRTLSILDKIDFIFLPVKTQNNERILFARIKDPNPDLYEAIEAYRACFLMGELNLKADYRSGDIFVWDCANYKMGHLMKTPLTLMRPVSVIIESAIPTRLKGIHLLNMSASSASFMNMMKSLMKPKIVDRVHIYNSNNNEDMFQFLPKEIIPKDYGGTYPKTIDELIEIWKEKLKCKGFEKFLEESDHWKTDENKRPKGKKNSILENNFGIDGSFRKLEID